MAGESQFEEKSELHGMPLVVEPNVVNENAMQNRYTGDIDEMGRPHGLGQKTWANGDVYDGTWYKGMRWGHGSMNWTNGDSYTGKWWNDKRDG